MAEFYLVVSDADSSEESFEEDLSNIREELSTQVGQGIVEIIASSDIPDGAKGLGEVIKKIGGAVVGILKMDITTDTIKALFPTFIEMSKGREIEVVYEKTTSRGTKKVSVKVPKTKDLNAVGDFIKELEAE